MNTRNASVRPAPILSAAKDPSRRFGISYDVEPWRGCDAGCLYCDAWNALPEGVRLDAVNARADAVAAFAADLRARPAGTVIGFGRQFEPYPAAETAGRITRGMLAAIAAAGAGAVIVTKSVRVVEDVELLTAIREHAPAVVLMSITSVNEDVVRKLEPGCPTTTERFKALAKLGQAGILTGVLLQPVVPFITDTEDNVVDIVRRAKEAGCRFVYPSFGIQLTGRARERFFDLIDREFPRLRNVYMDAYGMKVSCPSKAAPALKKAFVFECRHLRMKYGMTDIVKMIRPEAAVQLRLF